MNWLFVDKELKTDYLELIMSWKKYIPKDIQKLYEVYDYKHAATILSKEFPNEFKEICDALSMFQVY